MIDYFLARRLKLAVVGCVGILLSGCAERESAFHNGGWTQYESGEAYQYSDGSTYWRHGAPSRPYLVLSRARIETDDGPLGDGQLLSRVAYEVRRVDGDAALRVNESRRTESAHTNRKVYVRLIKVIDVAVIRYQ
jgi:hypothetical protein